MKSKVKQRPAESATGAAGIVIVLLAALGVEVSDAAVVAIIGGVSALPAVVTAIVERFRSA